MSWRELTHTEVKKSIPVFVANLFFSVHYAAVLYVNSSLLEQYFTVNTVSILFVIGALGNLFLFLFAPHILRKIGNRSLFFFLVLIDALATGGLALTRTPLFIALFFILFEATSIMIYFCLDIFLEDASLEENTGEIRGIDLTLANSAIVLGPLLVTLFVVNSDFSHLYGASTILLLPLFYLAFFSFTTFHDGAVRPREGEFFSSLKLWLHDGNVKRITLARFVLEFFYAFMVIYVPIYLHSTIGFDWPLIGTIFTIMLLPFVFLQLPAGEAADRWLGEKELLIVGFFFCGASVIFMPFIPKSFILWTVALFASRIGAALVEVMTDTYFFKKVNKSDTGLISIFRLTRSAGIVSGALAGILILTQFNYHGIFFFLGVLSLWGIIESLRLRDTL